jgi:SCP-2 sterol transfer family
MEGNVTKPKWAEQLRGDPVLADFLSPLPRLTEPGEDDLGRTFERLGEIVGGSKLRARVHFRVVEGEGKSERARSWSLELGPDACSVSAERTHRPDLEVLVTEATWRRLAEGAISPLEALGQGGLRVRGSVRLARQLVWLLPQG